MQCVNITEILKSRSFRPGDESLLAVSDVSSLSQELLVVDVSVVWAQNVSQKFKTGHFFFFFNSFFCHPQLVWVLSIFLGEYEFVTFSTYF